MPSRQNPYETPKNAAQSDTQTTPDPTQPPASNSTPEAATAPPTPKPAPKGKRYREMTLDEKERDANQRLARAQEDLAAIRTAREKTLAEQKKIIGEIVIAVIKRAGGKILDNILHQASAAKIEPTESQLKKLAPLYSLAPRPVPAPDTPDTKKAAPEGTA